MAWPEHARKKGYFKKGNPSGNRKKDTPEKKAQRKAILQHMKEYLENGEAVKDFERHRNKLPGVAMNDAMDRVHGRPKQSFEGTVDATIRIKREVVRKSK